jgi:hypothetical protein
MHSGTLFDLNLFGSFHFALILHGEDFGFVPEFNPMHAWFFCFGFVYLFWVFDV